jgi:cation diffusion facilitator family transporter
MAEKYRIAEASIFASIAMMALKLVFGVLTGSLALISDGLHSALDVTAATITWAALHISDRPADASHNYGHGKVESLSAFGESILLLLTAFWIGWKAVNSLLTTAAAPDAGYWADNCAMGVVLVAMLTDVWRSRLLTAAAKKYESQALRADALHFGVDFLISCVVLASLVAVRIGGTRWAHVDAVGAIFVAVVMVGASLSLARQSIDVLMDHSPTGLEGALTALMQAVPGVVEVRRVRARQSGNRRFVDATITVDRQMSMEAGHQIATRVEVAVEGQDPGMDITVHVEPADAATAPPDSKLSA